MLRVLICELEAFGNNVSLHEELSSPRSLTTVEGAREIWGPEVQLTLVVGSDLVRQIPRWYRVEDLLRKVQLLVVPRPGYAVDEADLEGLREFGTQVAIADLQVPAVSSTAYRENCDTDVLTPPVEDYIQQKQLYACQDAAPSR